jgi:hypothetical protein
MTLLAIPGDNTYSNYQEATRSFWRQTVLPLVNRTTKALSQWLSPAYGASLDLRPDLDAIEALSPEREALWTRVDKATFLTPNEKRAAVGYGPLDAVSPSPLRGGARGEGNPDVGNGDVLLPGSKYSPNQPRVPAGQPGGGQWTNGGEETDSGDKQPPAARTGEPIQLAQVGGASTMTDTGQPTISLGNATLEAPPGQTISRFEVSPLTNNVYQTPFGPVDVTGWTAYYGPPGSTLNRGGHSIDYPTGVIWFINPVTGEALARRVSPGM